MPQIEAHAEKHGMELPNGWEVEFSRHVKQRLLKEAEKIPDDVLTTWAELFARFGPVSGRATNSDLAENKRKKLEKTDSGLTEDKRRITEATKPPGS